MKQHRKIVKSILFFLLVIAFGASCYITLRPLLVRAQSNRAARSAADTFLQSYPDTVEAAEQPTTPDTAALPHAELYAAMQAYNEKIAAEGQRELCDPWAYTVPALDFSAYELDEDAVIGVVAIPAIDVRLPIYSGASSEHLNKGAALLSQTSFPIGGTSTNAVIGAHRGWGGEDFLRNIEDVQCGDEIIITNYWGTLHYTVTEIKIIRPNELSQVLIHPDRDLLTIFTCHPYASGGQYRYLLICERRMP